jgi:hydrogenase maturation protein HypF
MQMLKRRVNAPWCGSVGRLFDAVAALSGLRQKLNFEGQAAMELEFAAEGFETDTAYELGIVDGQSPNAIFDGQSEIQNSKSAMVLDWARMIESLLADVQRGVSVGEISAKFHNTLVEAIVCVASKVGCERVALSGGCFQNRYLTERTVRRLRAEGFQPYWQQRVPPNDGGIALGQVVAARRELAPRSAAFVPLQQVSDEALTIPSASLPAILKRAEARAPLALSGAEFLSRPTPHAPR